MQAKLVWEAPGAKRLQVRVGSPIGTLFAESGSTGTATTGVWTQPGTVFYLLDASESDTTGPEHVLAVFEVLDGPGCPPLKARDACLRSK